MTIRSSCPTGRARTARKVSSFVVRVWQLAILACTAVALVACAPVRVRETPSALAAQQAREARLAPLTHWTLSARIAISNGKDGGSGDLDWEQDGDIYRFIVRAPVTGKTWTLSGDAEHAVLEGVDPQPDADSDAQRLLQDRLGWDVPLVDLSSWVRGLRAPSLPAQVQYDAHELPAVIEQDGWRIEYRDWFADRNPPLPRKVFASKSDARVRMVIEQWKIDD
jgi:outer membrane lipoprotein LolB